MSRWRRLLGALWLLYFALRNALRAGYYLGAIPPEWGEAGIHGPWTYLGMAALVWAIAFGVASALCWWRGSQGAGWIMGAMILYQIHLWIHRLTLMPSPFVAQSHGFALLISLLTLAWTAWLIGLIPPRYRARA
ncbi:hypothetical protein [Thermoflexus sp.]|uniref:hypothetical protein n=1 Tax=Thermoflexus sp. TaxID=1969742 RepID=UPI0035E44699